MQINMANGFQRILDVDKYAGNNNLLCQKHATFANRSTGSVFGPQCKVTISREGRKLSEQMKPAEPKSFTAASTERLLLRQQKQGEQSKSEQSDTLSEISNLMSSIKSSYAAGEDKETIENKQEALNRLLDLKARQEEENERRVKDAASSAAGASKEQEEIDRRNADLYLMLKSLEEKDEEEHGESSDAKGDAADTSDAQSRDGVGDSFQEFAAMLGAFAAKRELAAKGMIDGMFDDGYNSLAKADAMMREVQAELALAVESTGRENLSDAEKNQLMSEHIERADNMMRSNYGEMMDLRRSGHQKIQDARDLELKHISINPLDGVDRAKQAIMDAGKAAVLGEMSQGALDKASRELEERVQEEIDKRNDITSSPSEDEVEEKLEEIEEEETAERLEEQALERDENEKISNLMN